VDHLTASINPDLPVLSAAGDGTASQVATSIGLLDTQPPIGFLPYGNFNDVARAHLAKGRSVLDLLSSDTVDVYPLSVSINDHAPRTALAYASLGWTATVADYFNQNSLRSSIKETARPVQRVVSLARVAHHLLTTHQTPLPGFGDATDILFVNNPYAGYMIRSKTPLYDEPTFGYMQADLSSTFDVIRQLPRYFYNAPYSKQTYVEARFTEPLHTTLQIDGEAEHLALHSIAVTKTPHKRLRVLHSK
jgi:diacylglycerol kinase family enzyme